jgi:hypothetical protein
MFLEPGTNMYRINLWINSLQNGLSMAKAFLARLSLCIMSSVDPTVSILDGTKNVILSGIGIGIKVALSISCWCKLVDAPPNVCFG